MPLTIPFTFAGAGLNTPTSRLDSNYNVIRDWINARNPTVGSIGARPAAGNAGAVYVASDQGNTTYIDDGAAWQSIGVSPGATFQEFVGIATPATPVSGSLRLYSPSTPPGLRRLRVLDAGGQFSDLMGALASTRGVGNPFKDVNTTAIETSIFAGAPTIKGGTFGADRGLALSISGDVLNNTGVNRGFVVKVKYGGTTFLTLGANGTYGSNANRSMWFADGILLATASTSTQIARALQFNDYTSHLVTGVDRALNGVTEVRMSMLNNGAVDMTADQSFDVTLTLEVNNALLSARVFGIFGWII